MSYRDSLLEGAKAATRLHDQLGIRKHIERVGGNVDVIDSALRLNSTVMFRQLNGILGAYMKEGDAAGIIVTTQRRLPIQRFTAAHEVGHLYCGHDPSIDGNEILNGPNEKMEPKEVEANGFAGEFMAPRWLLAYHARLQKWDSHAMETPDAVYQLSLRIGLSYEATCHSLLNHSIITSEASRKLLAVQPKEIKRRLLPQNYAPDNWHGDIWLLTEQDRGSKIEGHPEDLFVLKLRERPSAGYLWDLEVLKAEGFEIFTDQGVAPAEQAVGADIVREVTAGSAEHLEGTLNIAQRRAWEPSGAPLTQLTLSYNLLGKEAGGYPRAVRRKLLAA